MGDASCDAHHGSVLVSPPSRFFASFWAAQRPYRHNTAGAAAAVMPPGIVAEAYAEDIRREVPPAGTRSVVEVPLDILEGSDRAAVRVAASVHAVADTRYAAVAGPGTREQALRCEAVVRLRPDEEDTLAPQGGVTGPADVSVR